jgi:hypothetical protein
MSIMLCPHCGRLYSARACRPLIPEHTIAELRKNDQPMSDIKEVMTPTKCPGSGQVPRNAESDRRPLWKDGGSP